MQIRECRAIGEPGCPIVPVYSACFLIPQGETVIGVEAEPQEISVLDGTFLLAPMPHQFPLGERTRKDPGKDRAVYASASPYPAVWGELSSEQTYGGMRLAYVSVYPCRWIPSTGKVEFSSSIRIVVETGPGRVSSLAPRYGNRREALEKVVSGIINPGEAGNYSVKPDDRQLMTAPASALPGEVPYVIITAEALASGFEGIAELKRMMGLQSEIVTTEWITANFTGADLQERIRNFIIYAWQEWSTEYVLLGGDEEIIPHRGLYVKAGSEIETDIASDLYYAALDGDWNTDGDSYFGEPGEEDLIPEVSLGRLPVSESAEISSFHSKLVQYSLNPPQDKCVTALMLGELLWDDDITTWGADCKDEILDGTSNYGFTTAGIPPWFTTGTLYDRDLGYQWTGAELASLIDGGVNLINHLGHSNTHMVMRIPIWDLGLLENVGPGSMPFVCYSQGCYPAAFDNRDDAGTVHPEDAIGEQLVTGTAGAVAFIGNTRLGWSSPGSTSSVSQYFDRQFFDALFGEQKSTIGKVFDDSRIDNIPYISYGIFRYVMYGMCLLGDPAMPVWTEMPAELTVEHDSMLIVGQDMFTVEVLSGQTPVEGAMVSLSGNTPYFHITAWTDANGVAYLDPEPDSTGTCSITVFARNHYLYGHTLPIAHPTEALLSLVYFSVDDDSEGISNGDGDGIVESGEIVGLDLAIKNEGESTSFNTRVIADCDDAFVSVVFDTVSLGDMPKRTVAIIENAFILQPRHDTPDGHSIDIGLKIIADHQEWVLSRQLTVNAPGPILESWSLSDAENGNANGCIEAWEHLDLTCTWANNGSIDLVNPILLLTADYGGQILTTGKSEALPDIPIGSSVTTSGGLQIFIKQSTPPFTSIPFYLTLISSNFQARVETLTVTTCGNGLIDMAVSEECWSHDAITGFDGWHISTEQSVSPPSSWKCGDPGGGTYPNMMEAVLVTPPLCLHENSSLTFQHMIEAEAGTVYPYWAEDAGVVEISADGGATWTIVSPAGNYPCRASASNTIFLDPYQRCYSGASGWSSAEFDLSAWQGPVLIRFHFASNESYGFTGWYIDDIEVTTEQLTGDDPPPYAGVNTLRSVYPNPFNPTTTITYEVAGSSDVNLTIFDVSGRMIRRLADGNHETGIYEVLWDGKDDRGRSVSSGVYFCRLRIGIYSSTKRLVLLR